mmetsp:Transcript_50592/g.120298  ORF Transcript_50592/g.120298 Transcript_50592/m.120298 type:complete len:100 (-) Transcript_50592:1332-1631(-)|eukprot:CAMPEP_0178409242 /NCGR_PEP_ID=MMETSP0689_2-20121128/20362_1 /TAXON_ID=160604 /ORGANISM="Amphidinium massartii, Strain CS-259" /LENGTH=99 /DNA_ID=CAMNT_0020030379 /DNA_START=1163 /DNA_END=1462 /DNA_ORIENTATION=-
MVPAGQASQTEALGPEEVPSWQIKQYGSPGGVARPGVHSMQAAEAVPLLAVPAGQVGQELSPPADARPSSHGKQSTAPAPGEYRPAGQLEQGKAANSAK